MQQSFVDILAVGGKTNSLGRANEVTEAVLNNKSLLEDLYQCMFDDDAWVRMRAVDSLEKVCREHPDWLTPYVDRLASDFASTTQPSILWHMAEIYGQVELTPQQRHLAIEWMTRLLSTTEVDWIVAANSMDTLAQFARDGFVPMADLEALLKIQLKHHSKTVVRRARKLLDELVAID